MERGLTPQTVGQDQLAPGSRVVTLYLDEAGLTPYLQALSFHTGLRLHHLYRQLRPAARTDRRRHQAGRPGGLLCSGNRNFEGASVPDVRANYLASPPLVVAYAIAGTVNIDLDSEPTALTRMATQSSSRTFGPRRKKSETPFAFKASNVQRAIRQRLQRQETFNQVQ